jgi:hypothetical protein
MSQQGDRSCLSVRRTAHAEPHDRHTGLALHPSLGVGLVAANIRKPTVAQYTLYFSCL